MTEPAAPPEPGPGAPGATEPVSPAQVPPEPPGPLTTEPSSQPPSGPLPPVAPVWVPPEGGGGRGAGRGCCLILAAVGAVVAVLAVIAIVGLIFLGGQVQALLGTVKYETATATAPATTECFVREPATSFPSSARIHFVATFTRPVTAEEKITVVLTFPDGTTRAADQVYQGGGICVSDTLDPGLDAGPWALEFRTGTEVLATGGFTVTP